jgi:hypothetical protein
MKNIKTFLGFILVLIGVALTVIELGMAASEPHALSQFSDKMLFAVFLVIGIGLIYFGTRVMKRK